MDPLVQQYIMFGIVGAVALVTAIATITSRSAVYSALFLVVNLCSIAVFFLILSGPFIAVAQVSVYAGAIMVLFLFSIMLLGAEHTPGRQPEPFQAGLAIVLIVILLVMGGVGILRSTPAPPIQGVAAPGALGGPANVGALLFSSYLFPFEATSVLLLVALVGAVVLTRDAK